MLSMSREHLQTKILDRYTVHKRDLPWRDTFDPYKVFVSETMLQQTQVDRVIPKFVLWMDTLPTLHDLAKVDKPTLLWLWSGLWFNSRAIRLQQSAQHICAIYKGVIPDQRDLLLDLPGIWPYTSAAIMSFAYNREVPVVDTNIRRVLTWELGLEETLSTKELEAIAAAHIPEGRSNDWHNALMDYGALVATAKATGIKPLSKQSKFAWSPRQTRGKILKYLLEVERASWEQLKSRFPHEQFESIILGMVRDEILVMQDDMMLIA